MPSENNNFHQEVIALKPKRSKWKFALVLIFIMIIALLLYGLFIQYLSPYARETRRLQQGYEKYLEWERGFKKAMQEDTYGGKTPQETLALFIEALRKGDIELAGKYIYEGVGVGSREYEDKKLYIEAMSRLQKEGKLQEAVDLLVKAQPTGFSINEKYYFGFEVKDENNDSIWHIGLFRHHYSPVWKIQSL